MSNSRKKSLSPIMSSSNFMGSGSLANALVNEAQWVGTDIAATNDSSGNRKSGTAGGDDRATNLVLWSEDFTNAAWTKYSTGTGSDPVVTPNYAEGADRLQIDSGAAGYSRLGQVVSSVTGVFSVWLKLNTGTSETLSLYLGSNTNVTITDEWQRFDISGSSATEIRIAKRDIWSSGGSIDLLIKDAMLNTGAEALPYVKTDAAAVTAVDLTMFGQIPVIGAFEGRTNLVSTVLTDAAAWPATVYAGSINVTDQGGGVAHVAITQTAGQSNARVTATITHGSATPISIEFDVRKTDGDNSDLRFSCEKSASPYTSFHEEVLSGITTEWETISITATSGAWTESKIFFDSDEKTLGFEIRNMRAHQSSAPGPAHVDGSGAGDVYATDIVSCTPTFQAAGTIVQAAAPYGWSGGGNPVSDFARFWDDSAMMVNRPSDVKFDGPDAGEAATGTALSAGLSIISSDWNGVSIGIRMNGASRVTATESTTPSGTLTIANSPAGTRVGHMLVATAKFDRVLSDYEYNAFMVLLETILGSMIIA